MMQVVVPDEVKHDTALLLIGGGSRRDDPPNTLQEELWIIAQTTGTIVAAVPNVPNQPLALTDESGELGPERYEDDLLAESWVQAKRTGDDGWVIHQAMVESAVAAMDAIQAFAKSEEGGGHEVGGFVVSGGSKRGWTTWLTAAVDDRVRAIIPMAHPAADAWERVGTDNSSADPCYRAKGDHLTKRLLKGTTLGYGQRWDAYW